MIVTPRGDDEVRAVFDEFWRDIVMPSGEWDHAQVMRELFDYRFLLREVPKVYDNLTGGRVSKPNTVASAVIGEADEYREKLISESVAEELEERTCRVSDRGVESRQQILAAFAVPPALISQEKQPLPKTPLEQYVDGLFRNGHLGSPLIPDVRFR